MIIKTKDFKESCLQILSAIDSSNVSTITEALELRADGNKLLLNVTNNEYYCRVKFNLDHEETFRACTNAVLFLKLIANITSDEIEIIIKQLQANNIQEKISSQVNSTKHLKKS